MAELHLVQCDHYDAGRCRSCRWLEVPYPVQIERKQAEARSLVSGPDLVWEEPVTQPLTGFRNKAKMAVGGTLDEPTLGLVQLDGSSTDLRDCALYSPGLVAALPVLAAFIGTASLAPYRLDTRTGELKHLLVTESPSGELLVRFVVRSTESETRVRKHLPGLLAALPQARVVTLNIQPEHKAVLEGEREIVLTDTALLPMPLEVGAEAPLPLMLRPQSFFQTSTPVAQELYATARRWTADLDLGRGEVWDLYCGVGGFALSLAAPGRRVVGVELSAEAVAAGNAVAPDGVSFVAGDATAFALAADPALDPAPDLVVVNPPRRGIGETLADHLETSGVRHVLYSSCNVTTLAADLTRMPSLRPVRGRVLDMFPHTAHHEVLVLLQRR